MKESNKMRTVLGGLLGAVLGLGLLAGAATATDFEIVADSFTVINQVNLASATYMKGMPTTGAGAPSSPDATTTFGAGAVPGGMYFDKDAKTYKVWDRNAGAWVQLATGSIAGSQVSGSGTTNTVTKWTAAGTVGNSNITDNGTDVAVAAGTNFKVGANVTIPVAGGLTVAAGNVTMTGAGTADILGLQVTKSGSITTLRNSAGTALVNIK